MGGGLSVNQLAGQHVGSHADEEADEADKLSELNLIAAKLNPDR